MHSSIIHLSCLVLPFISMNAVALAQQGDPEIDKTSQSFRISQFDSIYSGNYLIIIGQIFQKNKGEGLDEVDVKQKSEFQNIDRENSDTKQNPLYLYLKLIGIDEGQDLLYSHGSSSLNNELLNRLLFELNQYIYLNIGSKSEIQLLDYQMIRTFGLQKSRKFILVFPPLMQPNSQANLKKVEATLHIKEFGLGTGKIALNLKLLPST